MTTAFGAWWEWLGLALAGWLVIDCFLAFLMIAVYRRRRGRSRTTL